jgi:hypothetical protein
MSFGTGLSLGGANRFFGGQQSGNFSLFLTSIAREMLNLSVNGSAQIPPPFDTKNNLRHVRLRANDLEENLFPMNAPKPLYAFYLPLCTICLMLILEIVSSSTQMPRSKGTETRFATRKI